MLVPGLSSAEAASVSCYLEVKTGFEPAYTLLQSATWPLGHSTRCPGRSRGRCYDQNPGTWDDHEMKVATAKTAPHANAPHPKLYRMSS